MTVEPRVIRFYPPNFAELTRRFPAIKGRQGILYSYGNVIYNPSGVEMKHHPELLAHEKLHCERQLHLGDVNKWWALYMSDDHFRRVEEIQAHRKEWSVFKERTANPDARNRFLVDIARRLSGPLYHLGVSEGEALTYIVRPAQPIGAVA